MTGAGIHHVQVTGFSSVQVDSATVDWGSARLLDRLHHDLTDG